MRRLKQAPAREGMVPLNVWIPSEVHTALVRLRAEENIATGEAVRQAIKAWLASRRQRKGGKS